MDIMQAIIDIEKKARGIVDSVDEMKKQNSAAVEAAVDAINSKTDAKLKEKKAELKAKYDVSLDKEMTTVDRKYADLIEKLDEKCKSGKDKGTDDIVGAVTGSVVSKSQ